MSNQSAREAVAATRRRPQPSRRLKLSADGSGDLGPTDAPAPVELLIEATDSQGEIAAWFDDPWWTEVLRRWADQPLTIHLLPSQDALLDPVVSHHVVMAKRVAPHWRVVADAYTGDVVGDEAVEALAGAPFDEVRLIEGPHPEALLDPRAAPAPRFEGLLVCLRQVQHSGGFSRPVFTRCSVSPAPPSFQGQGAVAAAAMPAGGHG